MSPLIPSLRRVAPCWLALALAACAQLPASVDALQWEDAWGDRGRQVLARDYRMCEELVEQRRSLMQGCLQTRGWLLSPP